MQAPRCWREDVLALAFKGKGVWNESHMDNPRINTLIDKISEEVDEMLGWVITMNYRKSSMRKVLC